MSRIVLILGDQLSPEISSLAKADRATDLVVMAEVRAEATYVPHHPKKIALIFAAMRKFAARLRDDGWTVAYTRMTDAENTHSVLGEAMRHAEAHGADEILLTEPGEWRLIEAAGECPVPVRIQPDTRFIASHDDFDDWAKGRKELRMEYFYREMRRKTGLLMDAGTPEGGEWNYDKDNRKPADVDMFRPKPLEFEPDEVTAEVLDLVEAEFAENFGDLRPFWFATDADQALQTLDHFLKHHLRDFGPYQDAMLTQDRFLHHALISAYMNIGLLDPLAVCKAAEKAYRGGDIPLNSAEGFIRQIIGWREYVRGIYFREGPDYPRRNALNHQRGLPPLFWGRKTDMHCLSQVVKQTKAEAYAHHIQRLMVTGNFALLAGLNPAEVHEWYLSVYFDAFEWVEAPNTVGMSQYADGGIIASKPYVSSGSYIDKMSDYCADCAYSPKTKTGKGACPFNLLYWSFLDRHRDRFKPNRRMGMIYATWDKMDEGRRKDILAQADTFLTDLSNGKPV